MGASDHSRNVSRRAMLRGLASAGLCYPLLTSAAQAEAESSLQARGGMQHSVAFWCFNSAGEKWDLPKTCQVARSLGCGSVELVDVKDWPVLREHGLKCAIAPNGMPGAPFVKGWNNPRYHEELLTRTSASIEACAAAGFPNVIAFTGMRWRDAEDPKSGVIANDEASANCVRGLKELMKQAEKYKVNVCLEHLNTRDDTHPMKGHPGYQGDDLDWVAAIIRKVDSPRLRLLFDIYHVQVMHGDVIRRIEQNKDIIGHVHTAGCPGRGELDDRQEINYPPIIRKLAEVGYSGFVGQEFIPTRNPLDGLRQAIGLCSVRT